MSFEIPALDYSRPVQLLLQRTTRRGTVHSVFRRAINLAFDDTLIVLLSAELPHMPNGIRIPADAFAALSLRVKQGMMVYAEGGHVYIFTGMAPTRDVVVSMAPTRGATTCIVHLRYDDICSDTPCGCHVGGCHVGGCHACWEPYPPIASCHWQRAIVAQHVALLTHALSDRMPLDGLATLFGPLLCDTAVPETPLARMALPWLRRLAYASWQKDRAMLQVMVSKLAGLGPGLTPSGDDVLGGFAAVMALLSPYLSADSCPREWIAELIAQVAGPRTTLLSRTLLEYAAKGEVAEQIGDLLLAFSRPLDEHVIVWKTAERVLAFGATSGADTLLGILLALRVLEGGFDDGVYGG